MALSGLICNPEAAAAVVRAQAELGRISPGHRLLIKDAARPMSVQRRMFRAVSGTPRQIMWPTRPEAAVCITMDWRLI